MWHSLLQGIHPEVLVLLFSGIILNKFINETWHQIKASNCELFTKYVQDFFFLSYLPRISVYIIDHTKTNATYDRCFLFVFREPDYTLGIFQSIGFKEFHDYLTLPADQKETSLGHEYLSKGKVKNVQ